MTRMLTNERAETLDVLSDPPDELQLGAEETIDRHQQACPYHPQVRKLPCSAAPETNQPPRSRNDAYVEAALPSTGNADRSGSGIGACDGGAAKTLYDDGAPGQPEQLRCVCLGEIAAVPA